VHIHKITIKYVRPLSIVINYTRAVKKTFRKINYKTWPNSLSPRSRKFEKNILYFWSSSLKSANDVKKDQFFLKVYLGKVILIHDVEKYKCSLITKMNDVVLTYALTTNKNLANSKKKIQLYGNHHLYINLDFRISAVY
jgi:hypothetical protein